MTTTDEIAGVILAGGESRRFGGPKALAHLAGQPLIAHVAGRLLPQVSVLAVAGASFGLELPVLGDGAYAGRGPLAGVCAGLAWAEDEGASMLVSAPCDVPLLPRNLVSLLVRVGTADLPAVLSVDGRTEAACALWPISWRKRIERQLERRQNLSLMHALEGAQVLDVRAAVLEGSFANVNTPDDLARLKDEARPGP